MRRLPMPQSAPVPTSALFIRANEIFLRDPKVIRSEKRITRILGQTSIFGGYLAVTIGAFFAIVHSIEHRTQLPEIFPRF